MKIYCAIIEICIVISIPTVISLHDNSNFIICSNYYE